MADNSFINEVMDFDPSNDQLFPVQSEQTSVNSNIYKTQPKNSKAEDGIYRSKLRFVMNPKAIKQSTVHQVRFNMKDENGFFSAISPLTVGDKNCPLFKAWKSLWFSGDDNKKAFAKSEFEKRESDWAIVQIIEDDNFPELVGQFKLMKIAKPIMDKIEAKMHPSAESKKAALRLNDYLFGNILEMEVQPGPKDPKNPEREQREISYNLCDFSNDTHPIIKVDGTPLFDDDQLDVITEYAEAYNVFQKERTAGKVTKKSDAAKETMASLKDQMLEMYTIASEYAKEHCPDLIAECSYTAWNEALSARVQNWINVKLAQANGTEVPQPVQAAPKAAPAKASAPATDFMADPDVPADNDLPF